MSAKAKFYIVLNHNPLPRQEEDIASLQVDVVSLPEELKRLWSQVEIPVSEHIAPIIDYLKIHVQPDDIVFVQGHAGATYLVVQEVKALGAKAVYAHSPRNTSEDYIRSKNSSEKQIKFEHLNFWEYGV
jgi:hypothetical protein